MMQAFRSVAFSRSSSPMRPRSCDRVMSTPGHSSRTIPAAASSHSAVSGEKMLAMPTDVMPDAAISRAALRMASASNSTSGRPSYSCPPSIMKTRPRAIAARSSGQSTNGGSEALAGNPMRTAATGLSPRRCTTALVKCVVPIITASILPGPATRPASRSRSACKMPPVTSSVVGVFTPATTRSSSTRTASVFVPPTSMPILLMPVARSRPGLCSPEGGTPT